MKKILSMGLIFFGFSTYACPSISGLFLCDVKQNQGTAQLRVRFSTQQNLGVYSYTATFIDLNQTISYVADGALSMVDDGQNSGYVYFLSTTCKGQSLETRVFDYQMESREITGSVLVTSFVVDGELRTEEGLEDVFGGDQSNKVLFKKCVPLE
ncbi:MAG: hypothetical protein KDD61_00330 [Bdellovibrionales bacterium]|nr:hypothetical protein [Bdellovibrionales bacterium]